MVDAGIQSRRIPEISKQSTNKRMTGVNEDFLSGRREEEGGRVSECKSGLLFGSESLKVTMMCVDRGEVEGKGWGKARLLNTSLQ